MNAAVQPPLAAAAKLPAAVWIDARPAASGRRLWGMTIVERQVRELARLGISKFFIWISPESAAAVRCMRSDLQKLYRVELVYRLAAKAGQLAEALQAEVAQDLLLLEGEVVYDERIFAYLLRQGAGVGVMAAQGEAALWLTAVQARRIGQLLAREPHRRAASLDWSGLGLRVCAPAALDSYVPSLRLTMRPLMIRVAASGDIRWIDHLMYRRTFKGVIDAVARYGYYHLVRLITRRLSETQLSPNLFTILSILSIWGAIPLFAVGCFGGGALVAWIGVIFDSVDGKLARLRLQLSDAMGTIEHLMAMPGLGLWYLAIAWQLTGGELGAADRVGLSGWILIVAFLLDKVATGAFKLLYGKELFDYEPLDAAFHLIAARRNISLLLLTAGAVTGSMDFFFVAVAGWTVATLGFHVVRFAWIALFAGRQGDRACR